MFRKGSHYSMSSFCSSWAVGFGNACHGTGTAFADLFLNFELRFEVAEFAPNACLLIYTIKSLKVDDGISVTWKTSRQS